MMPQEKKKALVLGAIFLVLAGYWGYSLVSGMFHKPAPVEAARHAKGKAPQTLGPPPEVRLDLLDRPREGYIATRNMFAPIYTKPELQKPSASKGPISVQPVMPPQPPPPPPPPPKSAKELAEDAARADIARFKVVGSLKRKGRTDVFLTFEGGTYIVSKGDLIAKDFYLTDMGQDFITVTSRDTGVEVRLKAEFENTGKAAQPALPSSGKGAASGGQAQQGQKKRLAPTPDPRNRPGGPQGPGGRRPGVEEFPVEPGLPPGPDAGLTTGAPGYTGVNGKGVNVPGGLSGNSIR